MVLMLISKVSGHVMTGLFVSKRSIKLTELSSAKVVAETCYIVLNMFEKATRHINFIILFGIVWLLVCLVVGIV